MSKTALFLCLFVVSSAARAVNGPGEESPEAPPLTDTSIQTFTMDRNVSAGRIKLGGTSQIGSLGIVIDRQTDSVYVSGNGQTRAIKITDLAKAVAPGNTAAANAFISSVRASLSTPIGVATINGSRDGTARDGGPDFGACSFSPCTSSWGNGYGNNYDFSSFVQPPGPQTFPGVSPELLNYDRDRFNIAKQAACQAESWQGAKIGLTLTGTIASCFLSETGLGALGCVAGIGALATEVADDGNHQMCHMNYPGPGKW